MQVNINPRSGCLGIVSSEVQERIKCRSWVRVQKCFPQAGLADFADRQVLPFIPRITETQLPVPCLEIIAKFSHLAAQPNVEEIIIVSELFVSGTGVVSSAEPNSGSYWQTGPVRKEIWNSRIRDCEGIKGILDWHTDIKLTRSYVSAWELEWVGYKRHSCDRRVEK